MADLSNVATAARGRTAALFAVLVYLCGCTPLIGPYSPTAYQNATSLKAETLALMEKATEPYSRYDPKVEALKVELDKAYEFVHGIPGNELSARQWAILKQDAKDGGRLVGRFFARWKELGTLGDTVIAEFKPIISEAFDEIICLEANKREVTQCLAKGGK